MISVYVFQSTHPRGCDHPSTDDGYCLTSFNPRTHEGCDRVDEYYSRFPNSFNPRTHEGCDTSMRAALPPQPCFNPRTHEGCDLISMVIILRSLSFNPRTHEGCDVYPGLIKFCSYVSIHAPTRGATHVPILYAPDLKFQSTHPRGVRHGLPWSN